MHSLEEIADWIDKNGGPGTKPIILDWDIDDDWRGEDYSRVTVWLKREETND